MMELLRKQAERFGARVLGGTVNAWPWGPDRCVFGRRRRAHGRCADHRDRRFGALSRLESESG